MSIEDPNELPEDVPATSKMFEFLKGKNFFVESTNFTEREIVALFQDTQPKFIKNRAKGPAPLICNLDALILLLHWLKTGAEFAQVALLSGYGESAVRTAISRAKEAVFEMLEERWWLQRRRPVPLERTPHPYIGLLCDSTSIEVFRPMCRFDEAKVYWDGKNKIYALKKEVCVMASPPHYALFTSPKFYGSEHDYSQFKKNYEKYSRYLHKSPAEAHQVPRDVSEPSWAILGDSAYIGDANDTPGLRKIALLKRTQVVFPTQRHEQQELARLRVPIECFFGRLKKLWAVVRGTYRFVFLLSSWYLIPRCRWDHRNFDLEFDLCVLLTNQHIHNSNMTPEDALFLQQSTQFHLDQAAAREQRRRKSQSEYQARRKCRLSAQ